MERGANWNAMKRLQDKEPGHIEEVLDQVRERGPTQTKELDDAGTRIGRTMWNWNTGKLALEVLFIEGRITCADRPNFTRMYDLPDGVIPLEHLNASDMGREEAQTILLDLAARAMGVATADDLGDYYRIRMPETRPFVERMAKSGRLVEVEIEGWDKTGYLHPDAVLPRTARGTALLSPFDNLIWYRQRVERLWNFHYRIEIYVPGPKRIYGYYVLLFMLDGELVGRVDLKTDRQSGLLRVKGAFAESGVDKPAVGRALRGELELVSTWLGMDALEVVPNGNLATHL